MGYTGGTLENPTYHQLGDHSEAVEIEYDPAVVSYKELLDIFWRGHDPGSRPWSGQYKAAIFYHGEKQKEPAFESLKAEEGRIGRVYTEVLQATTFYRAEDYHQKYYLRRRTDLWKELQQFYSDDKSLVDSTVAARVNGYLANSGSCAVAQSELKDLLPPGKSERVAETLCGQSRGASRHFENFFGNL